MALFASTTLSVIIAFAILFSSPSCYLSSPDIDSGPFLPESDISLIEVALNLEYLEAEFFLYGALGHGLDKHAPELAAGGPSPVGAQQAKLDPLDKDVILQFAWQEVGHLRAIKSILEGFPRPLLNLSKSAFAKTIDKAVGATLSPPFDPYANGINYLIASYIIPYVGLTGYVGANSELEAKVSRKLVAGLLAVESGQDAVIRTLLYEKKDEKVYPYQTTVGEFTNKISELRNELGGEGRKDEGLIVPKDLGAEGLTTGNVLAGDVFSAGYARSPEEIFRNVYGTGDERLPGGFYPNGGNGQIARSYLDAAK